MAVVLCTPAGGTITIGANKDASIFEDNVNNSNGTLWPRPGGDHAATASATLSVTSVIDAPYTWLSTPALVTDVQGWLNAPSTSFGWELINLDETTPTDFRAFYTRDVSDPTLRPELQITYTPAAVPEPGSLLLFSIGIIGLYAKRRELIQRLATSAARPPQTSPDPRGT